MGECNEPAATHCNRDSTGAVMTNPQYVGMEKDAEDKEICVATCPVGSIADERSGRCMCPKFSHEKHLDKKRFCECPAHATWVASMNSCQCATGLTLTHKGCVEDKSQECNAKPMSYYEEGDNSCVTVSNCATPVNCNRCEMRMYYGVNAQPSQPMRCTECKAGFKMMGTRCIPHDAPEVSCVIPA